MTLKEELEILRGEPIDVYVGDPMDIPCIETSDAEQLCKDPVVSVCMVTYNHEAYIRQAIESVIMQKADFEFELVIGEDCSQDRTREICFEYQKKYPDKIRVLWWHENVSNLGDNGRRNIAHCRGEFIAFCEGDDYWIDPLKLQKQVDIMRNNPTASFVFTNAKVLNQSAGEIRDWSGAQYYSEGVISGREFFKLYSYGKDMSKGCGPECFIMTASCLFKKSDHEDLFKKYDIFNWKLSLGDKQLWLGLSTLGDVAYCSAQTIVYRENAGGAMSRHGKRIFGDSALVKLYFAILGPYKVKIPFSILATALLCGSALIHQNDYYYEKEVSALKELARKCDVTFKYLPFRSLIKWRLFFVVKRRAVLEISMKALSRLNRPSR